MNNNKMPQNMELMINKFDFANQRKGRIYFLFEQ
jgi:hypothetical protein